SLDYTELTGSFDRYALDSLEGQIARSEATGAAGLIVRLDVDSGSAVDARRIVGDIRASSVPVIIWIAPRGARAMGPGGIAFAAGHLAVVGADVKLGDCRRVNSGRPLVPSAEMVRLLQEAETDAGRPNAKAAVLVSTAPVSGTKAYASGLADFKANSLQALILGLKGRTVQTAAGPKTFGQKAFSIAFHKQDILGRLRHAAARPVFTYLLLIVGICVVIFELYNPGVGAGGIVGALSIGFAFDALRIAAFEWIGLSLIAVGFGAYLIDLRRAGFGLPSAVGTVAFVAGSITMFSGGSRLPWWCIVMGVIVVLLFFVSVMTAAIGARAARPIVGVEDLIGARGTARTDIAPEGQVFANGTLWRARTLGVAVAQGKQVEIRGVKGLVLMVEPAEDT
ncbi:MAG: hypothetical protein LC723_14635, partial [Actinobacteria bacterium]|nr:hypothetical protein [Actinomycetota bacterium]